MQLELTTKFWIVFPKPWMKDERWKIKATPSDSMLGIKRNVTRDAHGNVSTCEHNMEAYVTGVAETFQEKLPKKTLATIFPAKVYLSKHDRPTDEEIKANLGRGYMRAVGMILWLCDIATLKVSMAYHSYAR